MAEAKASESKAAAPKTEEVKDADGRTRAEIDEEAKKGLQRGIDAEKERDKSRAEYEETGY